MDRFTLDGTWQLRYCLEGAENTAKVIPAQVPGNVEIDLMAAGELPDIFVADHILQVRPYEFYEWRYETSFLVPAHFQGQRVELVFHGVDCIATYHLNGRDIGHSDNMFIEHVFDVSEFLAYGRPNHLSVTIASAVNHARTFRREPSAISNFPAPESLVLRKPPHCFGWDIMPRLVSAGIWRSVEMVAHEATEFLDLHYFTHRIGKDAALGLLYQFTTDAASLDGFELHVTGVCGVSHFDVRTSVPFSAGELTIEIPDAQLWWPRGYGDPNLYNVAAELIYRGKIIDRRVDRVGIRTVQLIRSELTTRDAPGEFLFKVNDQPILCKGSNWVPLDALHSRDAGRYQAALDLFVDLNCNIIRCWGGNVYEDHAFYERCDRDGIMVWQDFAMACARYPQDPAFAAALRQEAVAVVRKLRNHPCIILWSGDNECDYAYADPADNHLTRSVLREVVFECDYRRPYLPSSPYFSPAVVQRGKDESLAPEQHLWGPRDYYKSRFYAEATAHFASEIGYHGCPSVASIQKFISPDQLWPWQDNREWRIHATDSSTEPGPFAYRVALMASQIEEMFGFTPDNLEDFALASQISQAEAKKFFIELFRLAKWRRTGIIWWNVLDGWPQFSDAVVDYYFNKKLAYHYIRRVQQPICVMVDEPRDWHCRVVLGNDSLADAVGRFRVWDADSGETLLAGDFASQANQNTELGRIRVSRGDQRLFLIEWEVNGCKYANHYLLGTPPFSFQKYQGWLKQIASQADGFV
jgi:beta-mannosidase